MNLAPAATNNEIIDKTTLSGLSKKTNSTEKVIIEKTASVSNTIFGREVTKFVIKLYNKFCYLSPENGI